MYPPDRDTRAEDAVLFKPLLDAGLLEIEHVAIADARGTGRDSQGRVGVVRGNWSRRLRRPRNFLHFLLNSKAQDLLRAGVRERRVRSPDR